MERVDLKAILKAKGLNLSQAAEVVGVDKATMTRWAQGGVPADRIVEFEAKTGVSRKKVRPDLFTRAPAPEVAAE